MLLLLEPPEIPDATQTFFVYHEIGHIASHGWAATVVVEMPLFTLALAYLPPLFLAGHWLAWMTILTCAYLDTKPLFFPQAGEAAADHFAISRMLAALNPADVVSAVERVLHILRRSLTSPSRTLHPSTIKLRIQEFETANGLTGARSMGRTSLTDILYERDAILKGEVIGPRIVASSLILDGPYPVWPEAVAVKSPESARQLIDQQKQEGADFIKIYSLLGRPAFFALADEAKQLGISFVGHVPMAVKASEASNAGMKSMEHLYGFMEESSSEADELLARDKMNRQQFLSARAQGSTDPFLGLLESLRIWNRAALLLTTPKGRIACTRPL